MFRFFRRAGSLSSIRTPITKINKALTICSVAAIILFCNNKQSDKHLLAGDLSALCSGGQSSLRKADGTTPSLNVYIELYSYAICPFCERTKALLDYLGLRYSSIEVNPLTKSEIAFSVDYKKVPIAVFLDNEIDEKEVVNGSDKVIDFIKDRMLSESQHRELITSGTQVGCVFDTIFSFH